MSLANLSVRRGVTFSMIYVMIIAVGLFFLTRLRLDMYPDITFPLIGVVTQYEGAGPREIEDLVTRRIEGAVAAVEGVKKVSSVSKQGTSIVTVEFNWGTDMNQAEIDVRKYIDFVRGLLPEDATEPMAFAFDPSMQPVAFFGLTGPYSEVKLREIAEEKIEPLLERLPGVASVDTVGGGKREVQVRLDPRRTAAAGISPTQVVSALRADNVQLPGGTFDQGGWEFTIQTKGRFTTVKQIEHVVVGFRDQVPVRLRDVAEVVDGLQEATRLVRLDGRPGIMILARKQSDANTVQAVRALLKAVPGVERQAGRGIKLSVIFNQADFIEKSIGNLSTTAMVAFVIALFVLLFFLRSLRSSLIVAAAIPVSVIATFSAMYAAGLTLNIISMAGLALAIGMLVDNSIVVLENIFTLTERGVPGRQAAVEGTDEVGMAITASTLTTLVVFLPILFVPGIAGMMFRDMAITICFSLTVSLIVARTGIPLAASRLLHRRHQKQEGTDLIGRLLVRLTRMYTASLRWVLTHRKTTFALVTGVFVAVMGLGSMLPTDFFPKHDHSLSTIQADEAVGSSLEVTDRSFQRIERIVRKHFPEVIMTSVDIGTGEGFIAMFAKGAHSGILRLKLKDRRDRKRSQAEIEDDLRRRVADIPGLSVNVFQPSFLGSEGDIVVEIYGHDLVQARTLGLKIKELVAATKGTSDVTFSLEAGKPEYEVVLDRSRLAALGLNTALVSSAVSTVFGGKIASVYQEGAFEHDIKVRGPRDFRRDERNLRGLSIVTPTGVSVPLDSIAKIRPSVGPATITRQDQQRMVTVSCAVTGGNLGGVLKELTAKLARFPWPDGFNHQIGGQAEDFQESFLWLAVAFLVSIAFVYMVMASQFESLLHPFLILGTIPLASVGVVAGLGLTGTSLSVTAAIGAVVLVGIVVNNAIVLVDTINQYRRNRGMELFEAVMEAGERRLRPILMTAGTTILGMAPLALEIGDGSEAWSPMARSVIGGLTTSTLLTLIVIPTLYTSLEAWRDKRRARREAKPAG
jgi:HAE1 family hydrophobic/amphiphilic exporter-1